MNREWKNFIVLVLVIYIIGRIGWILYEETIRKTPEPVQTATSTVSQKPEKRVYKPLPDSGEVINFPVNAPMCFNDKTKQDIYDLRKTFVADSPLYPDNYEPSEEVFGQIVSSKPWYGKYSRPCKPTAESDISRGDSLLSTAINNPNALIAPFEAVTYKAFAQETDFCRAHDGIMFIPRSIKYFPGRKLLEIVYPVSDVMTGKNKYKEKFWLQLLALNARDAGFNYVTAVSFENGAFYDSIWDNYTKTYNKNSNISKIKKVF